MEASAFRTIYIASRVWRDAGWGIIVYLATLSNIDMSNYEAAKIDGASMFSENHGDRPMELKTDYRADADHESAGNPMNMDLKKYGFFRQISIKVAHVIRVYGYQQGVKMQNTVMQPQSDCSNTVVNIILLIVVKPGWPKDVR